MTTRANTHYVTDGKLSIKLGTTTTTQEHRLGESARGNNGTVWRYVQASVAITKYDVVGFSTDWYAEPLTKALAETGVQIGVAQVAFAAGEYGWVCTQADSLTVAVSATNNSGTQLYVASTSGKLTTTAGSGSLEGVFLSASVSTTAAVTATTAILTYPHSKGL